MSCGATILVISPRQNLYTLTDSHEEDFDTRSAVDQKENYVKNQMRQHRGSIALTTLALLLIITLRVIIHLLRSTTIRSTTSFSIRKLEQMRIWKQFSNFIKPKKNS